ncbi:MAG TPA: Uma2 family endonuclease [Longimicrobium sp.]
MPDAPVRRELVRGRLRELPLRGARAGMVAARVGMWLGGYVRANGAGTAYSSTGFQIAFDPDTVLAPPIAFVRNGRWEDDRDPDGFGPGAPDLAVEIVSLGDTDAELESKAFAWLSAGCRMVVVVNPERRAATVYRPPNDVLHLTENGVLDGGDVVPGWKLPLRELFD